MSHGRKSGMGSESASPNFQDKWGELAELKAMLRDTSLDRDPKFKRDAVCKVIAFDTIGYDCSKLFAEMVMMTHTPDIVVKKMAYQFLSHYARRNPELATLCVNTMVKDTKDMDPMVRGLAVRSLTSLRLVGQIEYLVPVLNSALIDPSPYVRRNGVIGTLKLYHINPCSIEEFMFIKPLEASIFDKDAQVSSTAMSVLDEIYRASGGLKCDKKLTTYILNRFNDFNEWGAVVVLAMLSRYKPADQEEMFAIMNILDPAIRMNNSAVVLAATKIFIEYAEINIDIKTAVYLRLKHPLLTLISSSGPEIKYSIMCHLRLLAMQSPVVFEDEYKQFFINYDEPLPTKIVKLDILPELANEDNKESIISELSEYVMDIDTGLASCAVKALSKIWAKVPSSVHMICLTFLDFLNFGLLNESANACSSPLECVILAIKDLLARHPEEVGDVISSGLLPRLIRLGGVMNCSGLSPNALSAVVRILGDFGEGIKEAPYMLEFLADNKDLNVSVKVEVLVALLKLYFKRAPEVHSILTRFLGAMILDSSNADSHDRFMFYYRILKHDVHTCANVMFGGDIKHSGAKPEFAEDLAMTGLMDKIFHEFNSLSVIYGKEQRYFIDKEYLLNLKPISLACEAPQMDDFFLT